MGLTQPNQAVFGEVDDEIRWYKAPPSSTTITEHWNYDDRKDVIQAVAPRTADRIEALARRGEL